MCVGFQKAGSHISGSAHKSDTYKIHIRIIKYYF